MSEQAVIHRVELPLDGRPHGIDLTGEILHVAVRRTWAIDVWYQARPASMEPMRRSFQVFGTGHPIPAHFGPVISHKGTGVNWEADLVWHVLENFCQHQNVLEDSEMQDARPRGTCVDCGIAVVADGDGGWQIP